MKRLEHQFQRLLRGAAAAWPQTADESGMVPDARWLLRQRQRALNERPVSLLPVLQGGLAVACLLLLVVSLVSARQMEEANQDVFAVSQAVLTQISTP